MKNTFAICALLAATVSAHMQMSSPYPIRSPLNPNGDESKKDYSYTSPLDASGSNFPCKGYQTDAFVSVATYTAGNEYGMSLSGSATHGGGSCQLSLSYDTGKTFTVIQSMEGGCPLTSSYNFTIPSDAPSGQALLAWTWFNKIGNREMYMNCAQVTIDGGSSKRSHARDMMVSRADTAFSARPPIFIANVQGPGGCTTIESQEVNFPEAGPNVVGGVTGTGYTCTGSADFLGDGSSSSSSSGSSGSSGSSATSGSSTSVPAAAATSATSTTAPAVASVAPSSTSAPATTLATSTSAPATNTILPSASSTVPKVVSSGSASSGQACSSNGAIVCGADGTTWSMCNQGALTYMGSVAAGTTCSNGSITKK